MTERNRRRLAVAACIVLAAGCTPREQRAWLRWHRTDPAAAVEFLYDQGIVDRPGRGGVYEPWISLAECESGGNWSYNGSSGFDGGLQFHPDTWDGFGGDQFADYAWQASPSEQVIVAERVLDGQGWGAWPVCSYRIGVR